MPRSISTRPPYKSQHSWIAPATLLDCLPYVVPPATFQTGATCRKFAYPAVLHTDYPTMVTLGFRQGRHLQRYTNLGRRRVVGCIPYRLSKNRTPTTDSSSGIDYSLRVLVVSSQRATISSSRRGGWELDESITEVASRETFENAGVTGTVEDCLGMWCYKSKSRDDVHEGFMFPLNVKEVVEQWPEMNDRRRMWVTVQEVKDGCPHTWIIEALERLLLRLSN